VCEQHTTIEKDLATEAERPTKNMVDRLRNRLTSFKTRRGQDFQRPHCWMRDGTLTRVSAWGQNQKGSDPERVSACPPNVLQNS